MFFDIHKTQLPPREARDTSCAFFLFRQILTGSLVVNHALEGYNTAHSDWCGLFIERIITQIDGCMDRADLCDRVR